MAPAIHYVMGTLLMPATFIFCFVNTTKSDMAVNPTTKDIKEAHTGFCISLPILALRPACMGSKAPARKTKSIHIVFDMVVYFVKVNLIKAD